MCADVIKLFVSTPCGRAQTSVIVPLDCPPGPGPPSGASLGGPIMGQIGWGGPSSGPTLLVGAVGVSPCRCEPLRAGSCCGECQVFRGGKLIIIACENQQKRHGRWWFVVDCSRASVLETLLTAVTRRVLQTATYRRQRRRSTTDSRGRTVAEG